MRDYEVGKGKPPKEYQFPPKTSGNPKGRPRRKRENLPYESVLGHLMKVRHNGRERNLPGEQAFLLSLYNQCNTKKGRQRRILLDAVKAYRESGKSRPPQTFIIALYPEPGDVSGVLNLFRAGFMHDITEPSARFMMEPWAVQAALDRLDGRQLSPEEQRSVVAAVSHRSKVRWPDWWTVGISKDRDEEASADGDHSDDDAIDRDS